MIYWILGTAAAALSAALAFYFRKPKVPIQPIVTPDAGNQQKVQLKKHADGIRGRIFAQVSADLKKFREKFGKKS